MARRKTKTPAENPVVAPEVTPPVIESGNAAETILNAIEEERSEPSDLPPPNPEAVADPVQFDSPGTGTVSPSISPMVDRPTGGMLDKSGQLWDEASHENPPRKNADGNWAKKRGRKGGGTGTPTDPISVDARRIECRAAAQTVVLQIFTLAVAFGGAEWQPQVRPDIGLDEREAMINAWEEYFFDRGIIKMPSWLALSVVMGAYAFPRIMLEKNLSRLKVLRDKIFGRKEIDEEENTYSRPAAENVTHN